MLLLQGCLQFFMAPKHIRSLCQGLDFNLAKLAVWRINKGSMALFCFVLALLLCLGSVVGCFVGLVDAQTGLTITSVSDESSVPHVVDLASPTIFITSDGRVVGTDLIARQGDVYTFTGDIFGAIKIEKNGITLDGAGYAIKGTGSGVDLRKYPGIPAFSTDIVVKNVSFCDQSRIFVSFYGNSFLNNTFEGGGITIKGNYVGGEGNLIKHNVFINCNHSAIFADFTGKTVVVENDFINYTILVGLYGWVEFDGNYWDDYETLYPSAKEIDHTGIWDTPYTYDTNRSPGFSFVDSNPLVNPVFGVTGVSTVDEEFESPLTTLIIVTVVSGTIVSTSLLIYFKRHNKSPQPHSTQPTKARSRLSLFDYGAFPIRF